MGTEEQTRQANLFGHLGSLVIFGTLITFGLIQFYGGKVSFLKVLAFIFIIGMTWNVIDLHVMDWLIICLITPKWVVLQGSITLFCGS